MAGSIINPYYSLTWGDVKNRIVKDLGNKTWLLPDADAYARGRIEYYTRELFYPSAQTTYVATRPGVSSYQLFSPLADVPGQPIQQVEKVRLLLNGAWIPLVFVPWREIIDEDAVSPPVQTIPAEWSLRANYIRFFPTPAGAWTVELTVGSKIPAPLEDTDVSFWTQDGAELIIASTVLIMCETVVDDPDRATRARDREALERMSLNEQAARIRGGIQIWPYYA